MLWRSPRTELLVWVEFSIEDGHFKMTLRSQLCTLIIQVFQDSELLYSIVLLWEIVLKYLLFSDSREKTGCRALPVSSFTEKVVSIWPFMSDT